MRALLSVGTVIVVALELIVGISPFIPGLSKVWGEEMPRWAELLVACVSVFFAFFTIVVSQKLSRIDARVGSALDRFQDRAEHSVMLLRDEEFYVSFLNAIQRCESHVWICYFAPNPPSESNLPDRERYYRNVQDQIRERNLIKFRRIVRESSANRGWIVQLLSEQEGLANASLALLRSIRERVDDPHALSVQVVDDGDTWFVAVTGHERKDRYRDVHVHGKDLTDAMSRYYDRLWRRSVVLLADGRLTEAGQKFVDEAGSKTDV